jgi:hypothetical protein
MPRKNTRNKTRSRQSRGRTSPNRKRKARVPKRGISRGNTNPPADLIYRSDFLNQPLKSISAFKLNSRYLDSTVDRELCVELYKCLLKAPGFVDDKEWETYPSLGELSEYLFTKLKTVIPKGHDWHFLRHYHSSKYCIKYFKCRGDLYEDGLGMPLEWIELKKDHRLYTCIMYITFAISKASGLDYIYNGINDGFIHDTENNYSGYPEEDHFIELDAKQYRKNGTVNQFFEACKTAARKENAFDIYRKVNKFVPKTTFDKHLKRWLLKGIDLLQNPVEVWNFCYPYNDPDMDSGEPLMVNSLVCFEWSFHDNCFNHTDSWKESIVNEIGSVEPVEHGYITPTKHVPPTKADSLKRLYEFFHIGRSMYGKFFENKFKKQYDDRRKINGTLCARPGGSGI